MPHILCRSPFPFRAAARQRVRTNRLRAASQVFTVRTMAAMEASEFRSLFIWLFEHSETLKRLPSYSEPEVTAKAKLKFPPFSENLHLQNVLPSTDRLSGEFDAANGP